LLQAGPIILEYPSRPRLDHGRQLKVIPSKDEFGPYSQRCKRRRFVELSGFIHDDSIETLPKEERVRRTLVRSRSYKFLVSNKLSEADKIHVQLAEVSKQNL
jgi:hypothetical protein